MALHDTPDIHGHVAQASYDAHKVFISADERERGGYLDELRAQPTPAITPESPHDMRVPHAPWWPLA
ncbi:MAG: hypothetical protein QM639_00255 [Rhodocyclaceae bacterium]|jgi:hypothetical protein